MVHRVADIIGRCDIMDRSWESRHVDIYYAHSRPLLRTHGLNRSLPLYLRLWGAPFNPIVLLQPPMYFVYSPYRKSHNSLLSPWLSILYQQQQQQIFPCFFLFVCFVFFVYLWIAFKFFSPFDPLSGTTETRHCHWPLSFLMKWLPRPILLEIVLILVTVIVAAAVLLLRLWETSCSATLDFAQSTCLPCCPRFWATFLGHVFEPYEGVVLR